MTLTPRAAAHARVLHECARAVAALDLAVGGKDIKR
jgi:hypothetical protein